MNAERRIRKSRKLTVLLLALAAEILLVGFLAQQYRAWVRDTSAGRQSSFSWVFDQVFAPSDTKDAKT